MGSAVGGAARPAPDLATTYRLDDYGALPGTSAGAIASVVAAWEAIRAAIRALPANTPTEVVIPAGAWCTDRPLWVDWSNTTIRGVSRVASSLTVTAQASTALIVGLERRPGGVPFPADHRSFVWGGGPLDGSFGGSVVRLGGGHHLVASGTIADVGLNQWAGFQDQSGVRTDDPSAVIGTPPRQLTVDVAFAYHGSIPDGIQLCGMLDRDQPGSDWAWRQGAVRPWSLWFSSPAGTTPKITLTVATTNGPEPSDEKGYIPNFSDGREWEVDLGSVAADTLIRLVVQVDLATPSVTAYVGANQVTATPVRNADSGTGWTAVANLYFIRNEYYPFKIGGNGRRTTASGLHSNGEFTIYGMAVSTSLRYRNDGAGQPLKCIATDAAPTNDYWRYHDDGTSSTAPALWVLGIYNTLPIASCDNRLMQIYHGREANATTGGCDTAYLCDSTTRYDNNSAYTVFVNITISDLTIVRDPVDWMGYFGAALTVHGVGNLNLERLALYGGWFGFHSLYYDTMYPVYMEDVRAQGKGAAIQLVRSEAYIRNLDVGQPGICGVFLLGGDVAIDGLRSAGWNGRYGHALVKRIPQEWGYNLSLRNLWDDNEGGYTPCEGYVVAERGDYASPGALTIENVVGRIVGQGGAMFVLRCRTAAGGHSGDDTIDHVSIRGVTANLFPDGGLVAVDGPHWVGTVAPPSLPGGFEGNRAGNTVVYVDRFNTGVTQAQVVVG